MILVFFTVFLVSTAETRIDETGEISQKHVGYRGVCGSSEVDTCYTGIFCGFLTIRKLLRLFARLPSTEEKCCWNLSLSSYWNSKLIRCNRINRIVLSNGHISGTGCPIDFVFDPRVGFSGTANRMDLLPVGPNPRWRLAAILETILENYEDTF